MFNADVTVGGGDWPLPAGDAAVRGCPLLPTGDELDVTEEEEV